MDTLIIVVSYNDYQNTALTVETLLGQGRVVVWDNSSPDGSAARLRKAFGDKIIVHAYEHNALWTPALIEAVNLYHDNEPFILFSNNDINYRSGVIHKLQRVFAEEPTAGIVAPTGAALGGLQDFETHWRRTGQATANNVEHLPTVRSNYVVGASMMISKRLYDEIGTLDGAMPLGADDHDYCIRAKQAGYTIWVCNSAYVGHKGHASARHSPEIWNEWGGKSWAAFNQKWAGYYFNEMEAIYCHWNPEYRPGWEFGTGWMEEEERAPIWEARGASYDDPL
jgi:GT2 family glycosyltransferase